MDKGTEHVVTYNTKTRSDPVDLPADYITITERVPKFLRVVEEILRTYGSWDTVPCSTVQPRGKRLEKGDTIIIPDKIFHLRYRGIVGSLGYLVNMIRPDLAFAYSEFSKYVLCP